MRGSTCGPWLQHRLTMLSDWSFFFAPVVRRRLLAHGARGCLVITASLVHELMRSGAARRCSRRGQSTWRRRAGRASCCACFMGRATTPGCRAARCGRSRAPSTTRAPRARTRGCRARWRPPGTRWAWVGRLLMRLVRGRVFSGGFLSVWAQCVRRLWGCCVDAVDEQGLTCAVLPSVARTKPGVNGPGSGNCVC